MILVLQATLLYWEEAVEGFHMTSSEHEIRLQNGHLVGVQGYCSSECKNTLVTLLICVLPVKYKPGSWH